MSETPGMRDDVMVGRTYKIVTPCGNFYVTVNREKCEASDMPGPLRGSIKEVFATIGKSGGCQSSILEGLTRTISLALRAGVEVETIIKTLRGVHCPCPFFGNSYISNHVILSCSDAISKVIQMEYDSGRSTESVGDS